MKLTQARIAALTCPSGKKDMLVFDDEQRGLGVRVTAGGSKSYLAQYTANGRKRRVPLGSCAAISLAKARDAARVIMGRAAQGHDPASERLEASINARRKAAHDSFTLARLVDDWHALHLSGKRPRYANEAVRALRLAFADHLNLPAGDLDRAAVVKILDGMSRKGRAAMAARTAAYGKAAYSWAVKRGALAANPFTALPVAPTVKRDRVLLDDEIAAIWRATEGPGPFNGIVRVLVLTGQRREEVAGMAWGELSNDLATWTIPASRTKNGVVNVVPISRAMRDLFAGLPRGEAGELVFPGLRSAFNGFSKAKAALDKAMLIEAKTFATERGEKPPKEIAGWRLHDIRRSVATGLQKLGVRLEVTESVLGHVAGSRAGIVGVYQRHDWADEKRAALEAWGTHVLAIVERRTPGDNVVALDRRR